MHRLLFRASILFLGLGLALATPGWSAGNTAEQAVLSMGGNGNITVLTGELFTLQVNTAEPHSEIHSARFRRVYSAANTTQVPGPILACQEWQGCWVQDGVIHAAFGASGVAYAFYLDVFGRDSWNGWGAPVDSTVHYSHGFNNAFWTGNHMVFGDGDGWWSAPWALAFDVVTHELTHGVTQTTAGLIYSGESGALNEATSDIMAATATAHFQGFIAPNVWMFGEEIYTPGIPGDALRYMDNPTRDGVSRDWYPSRYLGPLDNGGVHWNSGIANLAFQLMVTRGRHPRGLSPVQVAACRAGSGARLVPGAAFLSAELRQLPDGSLGDRPGRLGHLRGAHRQSLCLERGPRRLGRGRRAEVETASGGPVTARRGPVPRFSCPFSCGFTVEVPGRSIEGFRRLVHPTREEVPVGSAPHPSDSRTDERSPEMRHRMWCTAATAAVAFLLTAPQLRAVQLDEARIFIEFNATDQDVGVHAFLDGEQWKRMKIFDPNGRKIFDVSALSNLGMIGLTEMFFEGEEPSLDELPLDEFFELFPEGVYLFLGETVEGKKLHRRARFSHDIPDAPSIIFPQEGDVVDPAHTVIRWEPVTGPPGVEIAGYEVIVENEDLGVEFSVTLPATATSVTIPAELLAPDTEYDFEVLAIEESGNQTITETSFVTG